MNSDKPLIFDELSYSVRLNSEFFLNPNVCYVNFSKFRINANHHLPKNGSLPNCVNDTNFGCRQLYKNHCSTTEPARVKLPLNMTREMSSGVYSLSLVIGNDLLILLTHQEPIQTEQFPSTDNVLETARYALPT